MPDPKPSRSAFWAVLIGIATGLLARKSGLEQEQQPGQGREQGWGGARAEQGEVLNEIKQDLAGMNQGIEEATRYLSRPWYKIPVVWVALLGEAALIGQLLLMWGQVRNQDTQIQQQETLIEQQAEQIASQKADTLIVRRAQLLATIYDCADPDWEPTADDESEICPPRAHPRARAEAVQAIAKIDGLDLSLSRADLSELDLGEANLSGADLRGVDLRGADLTGADFSRTDLTGANLRGAIPFEADLRGANLRGANLRGSNLNGADLRDADLFDADLQGALLNGANLRGASLLEADLKGAILRSANLNRTFLYAARLRGAVLRGANLRDAGLSAADLSEARALTQDQIDSANGSAGTILPHGLTRPDHWLETEPFSTDPFSSDPFSIQLPNTR